MRDAVTTEPSRATWIQAARWLVTVLVVPLLWFAGLLFNEFLHTAAVTLWCARDQVQGICPHGWFDSIDKLALALSALLATLAAMAATLWLAPAARLQTMWAVCAFGGFASLLLLGPLAMLAVLALSAALGVNLSQRAHRAAEGLLFASTVPAVPPLQETPQTKEGKEVPMSPDAPQFTQVVLETGPDGRARFREQAIALSEGKPAARLSPLMPSGGMQLRESPVGFRSEFHCTENPQWLFVLKGAMEIGLQDGSSRLFGPGDHFYSADTLPAGATFDARLHGHWSRQVGDEPLVTLFVRA